MRVQDELMKIPVNELMCLFDADQTCSRGFFDVRPPCQPSCWFFLCYTSLNDCDAAFLRCLRAPALC